ncbi:hypothetical protein SODALDRAFT_360365 [Sodiomyces alkalinus F11]|uniref:Uncharacterized protein n=1 Tax=Sodiomyces alkalinus (strain CBS 110278 / VKM F-3762 / F11) TaxID=1314773 RepID=A0A3N2PU64_SODAK|nr:hypothetical protein SODALDRAFT_360365 [Sodiomyces alkalinus F11]ROT38039.1 hypothetical protein SODALDRAFT_360365 [Sodiomyces alkalinus F11]
MRRSDGPVISSPRVRQEGAKDLVTLSPCPSSPTACLDWMQWTVENGMGDGMRGNGTRTRVSMIDFDSCPFRIVTKPTAFKTSAPLDLETSEHGSFYALRRRLRNDLAKRLISLAPRTKRRKGEHPTSPSDKEIPKILFMSIEHFKDIFFVPPSSMTLSMNMWLSTHAYVLLVGPGPAIASLATGNMDVI